MSCRFLRLVLPTGVTSGSSPTQSKKMEHETIIRPKGSRFYYVKSEDDLLAERQADIKVGRVMDSAGESLLYSRIAAAAFPDDTLVVITKKRGIEWPGWTKKPAHLVQGLATIRGVPRIVMFTMNPVQSHQ